MNRITKYKKRCGQMSPNNTFFACRWFSGVRIAEEYSVEGVDYCGPVKTSHKGFLLATLENFMKERPGGSYLVMNSTPRVPDDIPLMVIG